MKKLNENVLRKLIMETIDEQVITEGKSRKKRLKEVEPASPENDEKMGGYNPYDSSDQDNRDYDPGPEGFGISISEEDINNFNNAVEALNDEDPIRKAGALTILKPIADKINDLVKKQNQKNKE